MTIEKFSSRVQQGGFDKMHAIIVFMKLYTYATALQAQIIEQLHMVEVGFFTDCTIGVFRKKNYEKESKTHALLFKRGEYIIRDVIFLKRNRDFL